MDYSTLYCSTKDKHRFDAPHLDEQLSGQIRNDFFSSTHGIGSYTIQLDDHAWCKQAGGRRCVAQWSAVPCVWCKKPVASAFLAVPDGIEVTFEITAGADGLPAAELTRPHCCDQGQE